jgi:hypothetical protein
MSSPVTTRCTPPTAARALSVDALDAPCATVLREILP